ncbi:MAG: TIGR01777 family oxidoreductase [Corynebacterium sp.]|nr:TIGR01777 family oxidoreductase [Corynebacterium sp.]
MDFQFQHNAVFDYSLDAVFRYYESPGTVVRLTPDWSATILREPTQGLEVGSRTELLIGPPWAKTLTNKNLGARWLAEHTQYEAGKGFTDEMRSGPMQSWVHSHNFSADEENRTVVNDEVRYELPLQFALNRTPKIIQDKAQQRSHAELERIFNFRTQQTKADLAFQTELQQFTSTPKTIVMSGASGLVGTALSAMLRSAGHRVVVLVRTNGNDIPPMPPGQRAVRWNPQGEILDARELIGADIVINLAGAPIAGSFSEQHKSRIYESRLSATRTLVSAMKQVIHLGGPQVLISASATGLYGPDVENVSEQAPVGEGFLAHVCEAWEREAVAAEEAGIRVARIRTGLVLSARGGILGAQLPLYLAGGGGPIGGGAMWMPWIGLEDLLRIYVLAALNPAISGAVNAVAPNPVRQREFAKTLGKILRRPAIIPVPAVAPTTLLGEEGARELALSSCRAIPEALEKVGYQFRHPTLEQALAHTLGRGSTFA